MAIGPSAAGWALELSSRVTRRAPYQSFSCPWLACRHGTTQGADDAEVVIGGALPAEREEDQEEKGQAGRVRSRRSWRAPDDQDCGRNQQEKRQDTEARPPVAR